MARVDCRMYNPVEKAAERMAENTRSHRNERWKSSFVRCTFWNFGTSQVKFPKVFPKGFPEAFPEGSLETLDRTLHRYNVRRVSWRRAPSVPFGIRQWFDSNSSNYCNDCNDCNSNTATLWGHPNGFCDLPRRIRLVQGFTFLHDPGSLLLNLKHICTVSKR